MCTYYYLHYHHVSPCMRSVEYALHYSYCPNSTIELAATASDPSPLLNPVGALSPSGTSSTNTNHQQQQLQLVQQPCEELTYAPAEYYDSNNNNNGEFVYYNSDDNVAVGTIRLGHGNDTNSNSLPPCATGGCLVSQHCSSGGCRLDDLGGRWTCCKCRRGGNTYRWCVHPMKRVPDTLCYHVVCQRCWAD